MARYLTPWRLAAALLLLLVVGLPLARPLVDLAFQGASGWTAQDTGRVGQLLLNTSCLVAGTLALALPVGTFLAIILVRTEFRGRRLLLACTLLMLFVPLPMIASAWQALVGSDGWLPATWWGPNEQRRWTAGLGPAIWVHVVAGLPWVVFFVGMGLTWVERELEEDGLLLRPPWWVIMRITLPRCRGAIVFAAVWLALQTAGEITVVYMMQVATFAEDVHIQFSQGEGAVARAVTAALPIILATWALLAWYVPHLENSPPLQLRLAQPRQFRLGWLRWPATGLMNLTAAAMVGIPVASLFWKLGQAGHPTHWAASTAWDHFAAAMRIHGNAIWQSLLTVCGTGVAVSLSAVCLCWLADECRWLRRLMIGVLALAWALPGPIIGIGLKEAIAWFPEGVLADWFYICPSPLPLAWAYVVRFLPFAVALLWPVVRLVPREPREAARLEGHGPWHEFRTVVWPMTRPGVLLCGVLVAALSLGEVAASTRVETPGWESFAKLLFDRMHYGVTNDVAALCLLLLGAIVTLALVSLIVASMAVSRSQRSR